MKLTLADFVEDVRCDRYLYTKPGYPKAWWCKWCRCFLKKEDPCPVRTALSEAEGGE